MKLRAIALSTLMTVSTMSAFANTNVADTQTVQLGKTKVEISLNKGTQAAPEIAIAYKNDVQAPFITPDVYWEANEKAIISGDTQNNINNATIDQFLKTSGNTASFRVLINDGSGAGFVPAVVKSNHQPLLAPAFDLSKGKTKKCTVSYIPDGYAPGYWTASCSI